MQKGEPKNTNLSNSIFLTVLPLDSRAKVENRVVYQIRRMLRQVEHHEIEVQPHNTTFINNSK